VSSRTASPQRDRLLRATTVAPNASSASSASSASVLGLRHGGGHFAEAHSYGIRQTCLRVAGLEAEAGVEGPA
jgi:hypothetical protein